MSNRTPTAWLLPPPSQANLLCYVFIRYKYFSLQVRDESGQPGSLFTLHRAEAKQLATLILDACSTDPVESDDISLVRIVEGISSGGPPALSDLAEFRSHPTSVISSPPGEKHSTWQVWRQDDNGNHFLVSAGHRREEANQIAREFEERGHKQMYWTAPEPGG